MIWTPTQMRMLNVLRDGKPHKKEELHACLVDELSPLTNIRAHITAINDKLRHSEKEIVCVSIGSMAVRYRLIRLLVTDYSDF